MAASIRAYTLGVLPIEELLDLTYRQLSWQLESYNALDSKAGSVLAFDGILISVLLGLNIKLGKLLFMPLALISVSILFSILAMRLNNLFIGPNARQFHLAHSELGPDQSDAQLLVDLVDAVEGNYSVLRYKGGYWVAGSILLMVAIILSAIIRLVD